MECLAECGEPAHGYIRSLNTGEARWHPCWFLGEVEKQDAYGLTDGVHQARGGREDQDQLQEIFCFR